MNKNEKLNKSNQKFTARPRSAWRKIRILVLALLMVICGWTAIIHIDVIAPVKLPDETILYFDWSDQKEIRDDIFALQRKSFYDKEIRPLLIEASRRDQKAASMAIADLEALFENYKKRIEPFVDDLVSYRARLKILSMMPGDKIYDDGRIEKFVMEKFEEHLFNEQELTQDISNILVRFAEEIRASQNRLLTGFKVAVNASDMPEIIMPDAQIYASEILETLGDFSGKRAKRSV